MGYDVSMGGREAAQSWKTECELLNEESSALVKEVGLVLDQLGTSSEGSVVDSMVKYGGQLISSADSMLEAMNGLLGIVDQFLSVSSGFIDSISEGILNAVSKVIN